MRHIYTLALVALAALIVPAGAYAADVCYPNPERPGTCLTCPAPAFDRSPIPVQTGQPGTGPSYAMVDPWSICGTFCEAGQIPVGWPYGWQSDYWLRPNTNF